MNNERAATALDRIEQALARIEAAASKRADEGAAAELKALQQRHEALREKVEGAVSQIDVLLAGQEAD